MPDALAPVRVSPDELHAYWMSPESTSLSDDHQTGRRTITMSDGRVYWATLHELRYA